jgi:hypothetical protein
MRTPTLIDLKPVALCLDTTASRQFNAAVLMMSLCWHLGEIDPDNDDWDIVFCKWEMWADYVNRVNAQVSA